MSLAAATSQSIISSSRPQPIQAVVALCSFLAEGARERGKGIVRDRQEGDGSVGPEEKSLVAHHATEGLPLILGEYHLANKLAEELRGRLNKGEGPSAVEHGCLVKVVADGEPEVWLLATNSPPGLTGQRIDIEGNHFPLLVLVGGQADGQSVPACPLYSKIIGQSKGAKIVDEAGGIILIEEIF